MEDLSNTIYRYYLNHWDQLPYDKQFHFASRLHLWCQDAETSALLTSLRPVFTHNESPEDALREIISEVEKSPTHGSKNASELRRPYFERYPKLKAYVSVLFRINFLLTTYGVDCRSLLYEFFTQNELDTLREQLLADRAALTILSTHAVNFLYLYERTIQKNDDGLPVELFLETGRTAYDLNDKLQLQLYIYFYTHCIIGDSQFYFRSPPAKLASYYQTMVHELESVIDKRFVDVNLDNKFEFLVCAKIVGMTSKLQGRIFTEAQNSLSEAGDYLVDRHNNNPQTGNSTIDKSEHRNVLFILANRPFTRASR